MRFDFRNLFCRFFVFWPAAYMYIQPHQSLLQVHCKISSPPRQSERSGGDAQKLPDVEQTLQCDFAQ